MGLFSKIKKEAKRTLSQTGREVGRAVGSDTFMGSAAVDPLLYASMRYGVGGAIDESGIADETDEERAAREQRESMAATEMARAQLRSEATARERSRRRALQAAGAKTDIVRSLLI